MSFYVNKELHFFCGHDTRFFILIKTDNFSKWQIDNPVFKIFWLICFASVLGDDARKQEIVFYWMNKVLTKFLIWSKWWINNLIFTIFLHLSIHIPVGDVASNIVFYRLDGQSAQSECVDLDECTANLHGCNNQTQVCVNLEPFYRCDCKWAN